MKIEKEVEQEIISTSDSYINTILRKTLFKNKSLGYRLWDYSELKNIENLTDEIKTEIEKFILPNFVSKEEYCEKMIKRSGMQKSLNKNSRQEIWKVVESVFEIYNNATFCPVQYAIYLFALEIDKNQISLPDNLYVDYLFVDEAQDLTAAALKVLRYSVRESMILAGDNDQSIYQPKFSWLRAGINISGNSRTLNTNFRSTNEINKVAEEYRKLSKDFDVNNFPETFRMGPPVELHQDENSNKLITQIIEVAKMCINTLSYEPENICIIAPKKNQLEQIQKQLKDDFEIKSDFVNSEHFEFDSPGVVRLTTTQSCKGLDFPVVLFLIDHRAHYFDNLDEESSEKINRNMIYTAITRSTEMLHVFMLNKNNPGPIEDLCNILKK